MDLRRALLLFAIVLGLAAIASSIARPPEGDDPPDRRDRTTGQAQTGTDVSSAAPRPGTPPAAPTTVTFRANAKPQVRRLEQGRPATVVVAVEASSQVDVPSLGLTQPAEPLTPARFEVLVGDTGDHRIVVDPVASDATPSRAGTLKVVRRR